VKPNFKRDLAAGQAGEKAFIALAATHGIALTQTDGKSGDLLDADGNKWEIKADRYDHDATGNFFIELYSDYAKLKLGGPKQAQAHGCKYFVYYFSTNNIAYIFGTDDLVLQVEAYMKVHNPKPVEIRNVRWVTLGVKVARASLKPQQILQSKAVA
jgi:hypothetical protein